jgi:hypothetical protein
MLMHMSLDELIEEARLVTGINDRSALIRAGLEALIARTIAKRLAALGGTMPDFKVAARRRSKRPR